MTLKKLESEGATGMETAGAKGGVAASALRGNR